MNARNATEGRVLLLARKANGTITRTELAERMGRVSAAERVAAIESLTRIGLVELCDDVTLGHFGRRSQVVRLTAAGCIEAARLAETGLIPVSAA